MSTSANVKSKPLPVASNVPASDGDMAARKAQITGILARLEALERHALTPERIARSITTTVVQDLHRKGPIYSAVQSVKGFDDLDRERRK